MRAVGIPVGSPKPSKTQPNSPLLLPFDCSPTVAPFPRKSHRQLFKSRVAASLRHPPTTVPEPDPIYPLLPSCSTESLATSVPPISPAGMQEQMHGLPLDFAEIRARVPIGIALPRLSQCAAVRSGVSKTRIPSVHFAALKRTIIARCPGV